MTATQGFKNSAANVHDKLGTQQQRGERPGHSFSTSRLMLSLPLSLSRGSVLARTETTL